MSFDEWATSKLKVNVKWNNPMEKEVHLFVETHNRNFDGPRMNSRSENQKVNQVLLGSVKGNGGVFDSELMIGDTVVAEVVELRLSLALSPFFF